jgi:hypothetical protein
MHINFKILITFKFFNFFEIFLHILKAEKILNKMIKNKSIKAEHYYNARSSLKNLLKCIGLKNPASCTTLFFRPSSVTKGQVIMAIGKT